MATDKTKNVAAVLPASSTSFFDLPPELRNEVYKLRCLVSTKDGKPKPMTWRQFNRRFVMLEPVFHAHEQIANEAMPLFIGSNILHLTGKRTGSDLHGNFFAPHSATKTAPSPTILKYARMKCSDRQCERCEYTIEVPPLSLRHFFKNVEISLLGPDPLVSHEGLDDEDVFLSRSQMVWANEDIDWLGFLRAMSSLGFTKLDRLAIEVSHREFDSLATEAEFKDWTRKQIDGMVNTEQLILTFRQMKKTHFELDWGDVLDWDNEPDWDHALD